MRTFIRVSVSCVLETQNNEASRSLAIFGLYPSMRSPGAWRESHFRWFGYILDIDIQYTKNINVPGGGKKICIIFVFSQHSESSGTVGLQP